MDARMEFVESAVVRFRLSDVLSETFRSVAVLCDMESGIGRGRLSDLLAVRDGEIKESTLLAHLAAIKDTGVLYFRRSRVGNGWCDFRLVGYGRRV